MTNPERKRGWIAFRLAAEAQVERLTASDDDLYARMAPIIEMMLGEPDDPRQFTPHNWQQLRQFIVLKQEEAVASMANAREHFEAWGLPAVGFPIFVRTLKEAAKQQAEALVTVDEIIARKAR